MNETIIPDHNNIKQPKNVWELKKAVNQQIKSGNIPNLGTSLVGEQIIIASYKTMPLQKLEDLRTILNHVIKERKEYLRAKYDTGNISKPINNMV